MKIQKKHEMKVTMLIMVTFMTLTVSFVNVSLNYGFQAEFVVKWLKAWGMAFITAFPVVSILMPVIRKQVAKLIAD